MIAPSPLGTAALAYASEYVDRGWSPVPIPHREKGPRLKAWQELRITRETVARYFNGGRLNIGVILGEASHDLVDVDLDTVEALALAPFYLPPTESVFGRAG
jgi:hypothetical protein